MQSKPNKLKQVIDFILGLLAVLKWVPFLGKYRPLLLGLSTLLGTLSAALVKCDAKDDAQPGPVPTITATPSQTPTPIHTPSPSPTPAPTPQIVLDRVPHAGWPFTVRYTAPFAYNTHLWADKWRLQALGRDADTGNMIAYAVVLNTAGSRKLTVRDSNGVVLAEKQIDVKP